MDAQRMLRRLLPLIALAGLAALLARLRRARRVLPVVVPARAANAQLLLPPVEAALVISEEGVDATAVTVVAAAEKVVVPDPVELRITARRAPVGRFGRGPVDIVTVVDDLLGGTS